jgi:hypothetical protein
MNASNRSGSDSKHFHPPTSAAGAVGVGLVLLLVIAGVGWKWIGLHRTSERSLLTQTEAHASAPLRMVPPTNTLLPN